MSDGQIVGGRYEIDGVVGEGGMGTVFSARRLDGGGRVAIKRLHAHLSGKEQIAARFRREAMAADAIGHPNIVHVLEFGEEDDGALFMALELLAGRDLAGAIADDGPMVVGELVRVLLQVCDALEAAHDKGIVHRDLKPENIFLTEHDGETNFVKLLDFGISKFRDAIDGGVTSMTKTGTTVGTPYYMAPEQAQAKKGVDQRVDVYALGVIAFRALTGQHPFDDESYPMLVLKICTEPPPPITRYRADVPMGFDAVVRKCLAKKPEDRYQSAAEARAALAPFATVEHAPRLTAAPATAASSPRALRVDSPEAHARTMPATGEPTPWFSGPELRGVSVGAADGDDETDAEDEVKVKGLKSGSSGSNESAKWLLLALAVLIIGLGVALIATMESDEPVEAEVDLPEPAELERRPLVVERGEGVGWSWVNPLPRAMPTWYDVAVGGRNLVAMVGHVGQAARYQADGMYLWPTGTTETLHGVVWYGAREAIAVGNEGTVRVLRLEGPPQTLESGTVEDLRDVVTVSATEGWIVGDAGTLLHISAYEIEAVDANTTADLLGAFVVGDEVWVVGEEGTMLRIDNGVVHSETSGTEQDLRAIGGCPGGTLYAAGKQGKLLRRRSEGTWSSIDPETRQSLMAIGCDGDRAVITGREGAVLLAIRGKTVLLPSEEEVAFHGVAGGRGSKTWIVGEGGRLLHVEDDHLRTLTDGPTAPIRDLASIGGALVAVGEWGRIIRQERDGYRLAESPTDAALASLAPLGPGRVLAVGDLGAIVELRHDGATLVDSPVESSLRGVVAGGAHILAVGTNGAIVRGAVGALRASRLADVGDIWAVDGTPDEALAVGDEGLVLRIDGDHSRPLSCDVAASLRGVLHTDAAAWAVGTGGAIVRIEAGECFVERPPDADQPTLNDVAAGPRGAPFAVGDIGVSLERSPDGTWSAADLAVGRNSLRAIRRDQRNVYVAGAGGLIMRHVLLDGT